MPLRTIPLVTGQFYHIFNRGINKQPIFFGIRDYNRVMEILPFYSFANLTLRFSKFLLLSHDQRNDFWESLQKQNKKLIEIISFCFMPNHFHLLLIQKMDNGISKFMSNFQNSYTRYFNTKYKKLGPILQGQFKAVRVEDDNQLLHLSRYINLNPYSSFVVKEINDLLRYPWSSFSEYTGESKSTICNKKPVLSHFKNIKEYEKFVLDQASYQRELEKIKHLVLEKV
ncbi:MAG: transposase [bacterium]|nr:transposase [bacterium]